MCNKIMAEIDRNGDSKISEISGNVAMLINQTTASVIGSAQQQVQQQQQQQQWVWT